MFFGESRNTKRNADGVFFPLIKSKQLVRSIENGRSVGSVATLLNICNVLEINGEKKEALLIACSLHDIGQVDGREKHGLKAKEFTMKAFPTEINQNSFKLDILDSIERHDDLCTIENSLFCILVQFCDKMDFSKERLEDNYRQKFRHYCFEDILEINFIYNINEFGIDIITNGIDNFENDFLSEDIINEIFSKFCLGK